MTITRDEIRALCTAHDRMMAEHHEWTARREVAGAALLQKSDESAVLYREHHDNAPAPAPQPAPEPSGAPGVDADVLTEALGEFGVGLCAHLREETEGELLKRDRKIGTSKARSANSKACSVRRSRCSANPKPFRIRRPPTWSTCRAAF